MKATDKTKYWVKTITTIVVNLLIVIGSLTAIGYYGQDGFDKGEVILVLVIVAVAYSLINND